MYGLSIRDTSKFYYLTFCFGYLQSINNNDQLRSSKLSGYYFEEIFVSDLLRKSRKTILGPILALGVRNYKLSVSGSGINSNTFTNYLQNGSDAIFATKPIYFARLGAGIERSITIFHVSFFLGAHLSYSLNFNKVKWLNNNDIEIKDFPETKINGLSSGITLRWELNYRQKN